MSFDLDRTLRRIKPQRHHRALYPRQDKQLVWAEMAPAIGRPILPDTTVYIDVLRGDTPEAVDNLLRHRICHHSTVTLSELTHLFGRLDPRHPETRAALVEIGGVIRDIPAHRLNNPAEDEWGMAGMLAGLIARLTGVALSAGSTSALLNDTLLYLQAIRLGCAVVTRNIRDFDYLNQLVPAGMVIFYKQPD